MPQTMLTVRGNLGANPDYLPEKTMEDGAILPSKLQAVVYENRRVRTADGGWTDDRADPSRRPCSSSATRPTPYAAST